MSCSFFSRPYNDQYPTLPEEIIVSDSFRLLTLFHKKYFSDIRNPTLTSSPLSHLDPTQFSHLPLHIVS